MEANAVIQAYKTELDRLGVIYTEEKTITSSELITVILGFQCSYVEIFHDNEGNHTKTVLNLFDNGKLRYSNFSDNPYELLQELQRFIIGRYLKARVDVRKFLDKQFGTP